jgi:hypothetical protein
LIPTVPARSALVTRIARRTSEVHTVAASPADPLAVANRGRHDPPPDRAAAGERQLVHHRVADQRMETMTLASETIGFD